MILIFFNFILISNKWYTVIILFISGLINAAMKLIQQSINFINKLNVFSLINSIVVLLIS